MTPAQSAIPIYRFRSATLRARTTRLANESTKSAQPRHSPPRRYDTPLASDARNGRKHTITLDTVKLSLIQGDFSVSVLLYKQKNAFI